MKVRHLLSINDLDPNTLCYLVDKSLAIAKGEMEKARPLAGQIVGIYFRRPSTRTRTAFTSGALRLGAQTVAYGPNDLQLVTGETISDTGRVLSGFLDALVVRTNDTLSEMLALAEQNKMAVINAMSENEHPTQAIADLVTIKEALGRLSDVHVMYIGEGNNTAVALALAIARLRGMQLTLVTPEGYGLPDSALRAAQELADHHGASVSQKHCLSDLPRNVDVVYTTRWQTMGMPKADSDWLTKFEPYRVTPSLMRQVSKSSGTIFLHDLPAIRGSEVVNEVLDGPQSLAFRQAYHKMTSAMSILMWSMVRAVEV
ncbi:MAG: ornithine carbamoyltransferase [Blastocatellia bacterium]